MNGNVSSGMGLFLVIYGVGFASWILAFIFYRRARRHYVGPTGWARFTNPFSRFMPKYYTADGNVFLRWHFICVVIFLTACFIGLEFARFKTLGHL
jgi:hypothetical protein